ncbi:glutamine--tRNA ligase/YqeY domain fusion protein [Pseudoteredinibacter isoporae]|uniref:Glutamine--tRNA ligase n=1 Tax=Pseudoteredinibacter isoporae TaxID=570281 RepID=A0A7X0JVP0_9GAMM|nr:glutamine--tRNA ligase/YqeY domain fusion protein [Pseudoteredinibacter isoporae]MBB6523108.1 glutaminyl-tRNA synthetase [Pseudoteredinibacter isoporae]NHO88628.1 glutamine--tRNA ligase/YqeY domain fusion protein [Pseudoteredinibacter isoporae]NIB22681.1 glutamine--tRNA ligase/YqeY domain fusion protein [Pseudoteredinibacter isoporae]
MSETSKPLNFLEQIITQDLEAGRHDALVTRFPPEPNGYLHIGHAKSICLNFGLAERFGGRCNLRFDDTNPAKEDQEYVESIVRDVQWLGFDWDGDIRYASSYFEQFYEWALHLIREGKAYVCHLSAEQTKEYRGWATKPGKDSPHRDRSVEENLAEFEKMRAGEYDEGACVLRAKIDMASPNMNMRDPMLYRIRKQAHHQTGDKWCIYPTYDFAHGQEDAIEGITHSICTLEFADHRPLYEWFIENLPVPSTPKQYEFARLELNYTVTSKRKLKQLVDEGFVDGWDDPRMPTISGLRRRGVTPAAVRNFCDVIGVTKSGSTIDVATLEHAIRDDLNNVAPRAMCVLDPLLLTVVNFDQVAADGHAVEEGVATMQQPVHPNDESRGIRELPFTETLYIDRADFNEDSSLSRKKFKRLVAGEYVRLRGSYVIKAEDVIKNDAGDITEIKVSLVAATVGSNPPEGIRPRGVIHWVSASHNIDCEVRLYDRLFNDAAPDAGDKNFLDYINPESLSIVSGAKAEMSLHKAKAEEAYQFEREGYFCLDAKHSQEGSIVFNRTIGLKDTWANKV